MRQPQTGIKPSWWYWWSHVAAQGIEGLCRALSLSGAPARAPRSSAERLPARYENGRDADLRFAFSAAPHGRWRYAGRARFQHMDLVVVHHLVDRRGALKILVFQILRILPEGFVSREIVGARVAFFQHRTELSAAIRSRTLKVNARIAPR